MDASPAGGAVEPVGRRPDAGFETRVADTGRMVLARAQGPLDSNHAAGFLERLRTSCAPGRCLVLDLRRVDCIDSDGVRALLALQEAAVAAQTELRTVVQPGSRVARTLSLLRLQDQLATFDSASDAWIRRAKAA